MWSSPQTSRLVRFTLTTYVAPLICCGIRVLTIEALLFDVCQLKAGNSRFGFKGGLTDKEILWPKPLLNRLTNSRLIVKHRKGYFGVWAENMIRRRCSKDPVFFSAIFYKQKFFSTAHTITYYSCNRPLAVQLSAIYLLYILPKYTPQSRHIIWRIQQNLHLREEAIVTL